MARRKLENLQVRLVLALKRLVYGRRGEPYEIAGQVLRFTPGTRPVRLKYADSIYNNDTSRYDALQLRYLAEHLRSGHRAIDVGAHHGQDSLLMAAMCGPNGEVTAFEPNPAARAVFEKNVALNPHVKPPELIAAAVSNREGTATLFSSGATANSTLSSATGGAEEHEVPTVTLDGWITNLPDLVKIDIEGFEIQALRAAERLLASDATILCELHPYAWPALGDTFEDLKAILRRHGRRIRYLDAQEEAAAAKYGIALLERAV